MPRQLDLFARPADPELDFTVERGLAGRLPPHVFMGTSSWTFTGWSNIVYPGKPSEEELLERGLEMYARYPLFRTVGIDRSYYRPLDEATLRRYAAQLPAGFRCVAKVWNEITTVPRSNQTTNSRFLDPVAFVAEVLAPIERAFAEHAGPLVFEFPPTTARALPPSEFARRLDEFLARIPGGWQYAVELRNRELLNTAYLEMLARHGAAHVLNFWENMPDIGAQLDVPDILCAPFVVARLLIPPTQRYAARKTELAPFDRIVDPQERMRSDMVRLADACKALGKVLFVTVNNKAEGSSPLTVRALAERMARPLRSST